MWCVWDERLHIKIEPLIIMWYVWDKRLHIKTEPLLNKGGSWPHWFYIYIPIWKLVKTLDPYVFDMTIFLFDIWVVSDIYLGISFFFVYVFRCFLLKKEKRKRFVYLTTLIIHIMIISIISNFCSLHYFLYRIVVFVLTPIISIAITKQSFLVMNFVKFRFL